MVNGMNEAELEKEDGGLLDHAAEVHDFDELLAGKPITTASSEVLA